MAYQVNPEVDVEGNYLGSSIETKGEGYWKGDQSELFHQDVYGNTTHVFDGVEIEDPEGTPYQDSDYLEALVQLHGGDAQFQTKLAWAADNVDPSRVAWFNEALDKGDTNSLNEAFDWLSGEYEAALDAPEEETEEVTEIDDWFETVSDEVLDAEIDNLLSAEFGESEVEQLESAAQYFDAGTAESAIIMYGLSVAAGQISMEDAIEQVTSSYGEAATYHAYTQLQQLLN
jgi:hypothetical protein